MPRSSEDGTKKFTKVSQRCEKQFSISGKVEIWKRSGQPAWAQRRAALLVRRKRQVTPEFIREAAIARCKGETFCAPNIDLPNCAGDLTYTSSCRAGQAGAHRRHVRGVCADAGLPGRGGRGRQGGAVTPVWPNLPAQALIMGPAQAGCRWCPGGPGRWTCEAAGRHHPGDPPADRHAPNSRPAGHSAGTDNAPWSTADGTWILADSVRRLYFEPGGCAPSFLDVAQPDDRLIIAPASPGFWCGLAAGLAGDATAATHTWAS
jgi:hypothetical protein